MNHDHDTPAELREIDAALARLALADRVSAPAGFDDRLAAAVRSATAEALARRVAGRARPTTPRPRAVFWPRLFTPMRAAAALGIVAGVVALRVATMTPVSVAPAGSTLGADLDAYLSVSLLLDDGLGDLAQRIDLLHADLVTFDAGLDRGIGTDAGEWLEGGAM